MFGLKFNPFHSDIPTSAIYQSEEIEKLIFRIENLTIDGGIAGIFGDPGLGKSLLLRQLQTRLEEIPELTVAISARPQNNMRDFYRELGCLFGVDFRVSNRWGGFQALRQAWVQHIDTTLFRPILIVDEAQNMASSILTELRLLASDKLDSRRILTVVLAGDHRLSENLRTPDLLPLNSRIRVRHNIQPFSKERLSDMLHHLLEECGNTGLMTNGLISLLSEHSLGNPRLMMHMADELLVAAAERNKSCLDDGLYYDVFQEKLGKSASKRASK
jgi:type II secretory pathway predicted ATPase ExeA